jgi:DNA polymerase III delta prime subunit
MERSLHVAPGLWAVLTGAAHGDGISLGGRIPGLEDWLCQPVITEAAAALRGQSRQVVIVLADAGAIATSRIAALCELAGFEPLAQHLAADDAEGLARLSITAVASGKLPVALTVHEHVDGMTARRLDVTRVTGPILVAATPGSLRLDGADPILTVSAGPVSMMDRRRAWMAAARDLGHDCSPQGLADLASELAVRHVIDPALVAQIGSDLRAGAHRRPDALSFDVRAAVSRLIRARASVHLPAGVSLTTAEVPWDRLVLPDDAESQLREAVSRLDHQALVLEEWGLAATARAARGVRLLFTGPPGTGKSLAAEVVATAAGTDLLTVDVSNVVSKWIGETEKNLATVFDVAERTQAVLFLDESDALFGARTEIADAHDRYANLETAYLLQRLDRFEGLAVLATNLRQNIDPAFLRRMDAVVEFTLPNATSRRRLWEIHLPPSLRGEDVNLQDLADRCAVPGGSIHNAAVAAVFLAAAESGAVRQHHLVSALSREYAKESRSFPSMASNPRRSAGQVPIPDQRAVRSVQAATLNSKESR